MKMSSIAWGLVFSVTTAGTVWSQTLADVARKEEDRRKAVGTPAKVYTNDDLRRVPVSTPEAPSGPAEGQPASETAPAAVAKTDVAKTDVAKADVAKAETPSIDQGEQHWRKRMGDARSARSRSDTYLEALESRLQTLQQTFYNEPDPALRAGIGAQRNRVFDDMEKLKKEIGDQDSAIAKIEEDARKANIPPGWIR